MNTPSRAQLLACLRAHEYCAQSSRSPEGAPQVALMGAVVTDAFEVFFDTLDSTRKIHNLRSDPRVAFAFGSTAGGDMRTVQFEGLADEPSGSELERLQSLYFARFPRGIERRAWPGLVYVRARPVWLRYGDFATTPPVIATFDAAQLTELR